MSRDELLRSIADAHSSHHDKYGDEVKPNLAHSNPHDGQRSDYHEHHSAVSAPAEVDDKLNQRIVDLIEQHNRML